MHLMSRLLTTLTAMKNSKEYMREYRLKNKDRIQEQIRDWKRANNTRARELNRNERLRLKMDVLSHYSILDTPICSQCGFSDIRALHLDHINNDGAASRRAITGSRTTAGTTYYRWVRKNNYPDGYQVLCANCNYIKYMETYGDSTSL